MRTPGRQALPLAPLLHAYTTAGVPSIAELHRLPGLGPRFAAVLSASARFLFGDFLTTAPDDRLRDVLGRFYEQAVALPLHATTLGRRAGFVRHALSHLLHGEGPAGARLHACLAPTGAYRVPGLGPSFWSAVLQGMAPARHPAWTAATHAGLCRLGLVALPPGAGPAATYSALADAHARIRAARPELTSLHIDHFLSLVALMRGRNLLEGADELGRSPVEYALKRLRADRPLRQRLKERGEALASAQQTMELALARGDAGLLSEALAKAEPLGAARSAAGWARDGEALLNWARELWQTDEPYGVLARFWQEVPGAGLWLPTAVLHLRDPQQYGAFADAHRAGLARLDDGIDPGDPPAERYRLFNEACAWLRQRHTMHPLELPDLLAALAGPDDRPEPASASAADEDVPIFRGLCADTFAFLGELERQNSREWMESQRVRYHFAVRGPLTELCDALVERYIGPVLTGTHGWDLETSSRSGRALTSICKNVFGKALPYNSVMWITFCPQGPQGRQGRQGRASAQLFVRLAPDGLRWGLRLGRSSREALARLRAAVAEHADALAGLLRDSGAFESVRFGQADLPESLRQVRDAAGLRAWAAGRSLEASCALPPGEAALGGEELVGDIARTFDRLLPLFGCCVEDDPCGLLTRLGVVPEAEPRRESVGDHEASFLRETHLSPDWLAQARELLSLKRQLILQGVPGTGKTHVARCLGRLLAGGRDEAFRLVQFHPAYSYEEFVEGIKVRSVQVEGGRHDVTYPVEDGLLCAFATRAALHPAEPHVLVIDEINRGNLPRIFGELLYLLEYRGQAVELPYSRRAFRLPENLYLIGTMNGADRSIAALDQALRRRFSFLEMPPSAEVLASWLTSQLPGEHAFASRVLSLFDRLNARLRGELGPQAQVGHSYFMVPGLDEARLRVVWRHQVRPLIDDLFAGQPGRAAAYDQLLEPARDRPRAGRTVPASPPDVLGGR